MCRRRPSGEGARAPRRPCARPGATERPPPSSSSSPPPERPARPTARPRAPHTARGAYAVLPIGRAAPLHPRAPPHPLLIPRARAISSMNAVASPSAASPSAASPSAAAAAWVTWRRARRSRRRRCSRAMRCRRSRGCWRVVRRTLRRKPAGSSPTSPPAPPPRSTPYVRRACCRRSFTWYGTRNLTSRRRERTPCAMRASAAPHRPSQASCTPTAAQTAARAQPRQRARGRASRQRTRSRSRRRRPLLLGVARCGVGALGAAAACRVRAISRAVMSDVCGHARASLCVCGAQLLGRAARAMLSAGRSGC